MFFQKAKSMKTIKWIWRESRGVRWLCVLTAALGVAGTAASLLFVWATKHIVDIATGVSDSDFRNAVWLMICTLATQLALSAVSRRVGVIASSRFSMRLRSRLFSHLMHSQWRGREPFHSADSISRLTSDVGTLSGLATGTLPGTLVTIIQLAAASAFLIILDSRMAMAIVVIMPVALALSKLYMKPARRLTKEIREEETEINRTMQESLRHRRVMMSLPERGGSVGRFDDTQSGFYRLILKRNDISIYASTAVTLGFMAGYTAAFLWCASGLMAGTVTFGVMTAFLQLVSQVQRPVVDLAGRVPQYIHAGVAAERIDQLAALPREAEEDGIALPSPVGLKMEGVSYSYPDGEESPVDDFSHDFRPGTMTAIAGDTGAGKTTLLMLMLGLARPARGSVELYADGKSITAGSGARSNIVYVAQGNSLISGTVRENLLMSRPKGDAPSEDEMKKALRDACADFVLSLPQGLDTHCGEGGGGFSEGEAQRIAVARGLLGKGGLMLLDEPTSALDEETSKRLMETLKRVSGTKTMVIVTHRQDTMGMCDETVTVR